MQRETYVTVFLQRNMNKTQNMSPDKIASVPVDTFLYRAQEAQIELLTFAQFPGDSLRHRWDTESTHGRGDEKLTDEVYVWTVENAAGGQWPAGRAAPKPLVQTTTEHQWIRPIDVHEISSQFFAVRKPEEGLRLFAECGVFGAEHRRSKAWRFVRGLSFVDLLQWQDLLKKCRLVDPRDWEAIAVEFPRLRNAKDILRAPELSINLDSPIRIRLFCDSVRDAILAAIYLDKLANVTSSMCHRPDCGVVFNHESKHQRKYCSSDCAHVEAVRKSRQRKGRA
jgi:CGNR zinc finger